MTENNKEIEYFEWAFDFTPEMNAAQDDADLAPSKSMMDTRAGRALYQERRQSAHHLVSALALQVICETDHLVVEFNSGTGLDIDHTTRKCWWTRREPMVMVGMHTGPSYTVVTDPKDPRQ